VELDGYEPFRRTWSDVLMGGIEAPIDSFAPVSITTKLIPKAEAEAHPGMVFVPSGEHRLAAWWRPTDETVLLDDYWIDKFEVTNRKYKDFVDQGGYQNASYWPEQFVKDGRKLARAEAMRELIDKTGKAGPREWSHGTYPEGDADHPVTGVTWYEAAAYAAFRGKSLPTIFQWERAAKYGATNNFLGVTMPWGLFEPPLTGRANLGPHGTVSVGSFEFGMSPFGCYEMAGNVSEWCRNETATGFIACGGSWASNPMAWGVYARYPGFRHSPEVGFRCVLNPPGSASDQGAVRIALDEKVPQFAPEPEAEVRKWIAKYYSYVKESPLEVDVRTTEANDWWRDRIEYNGADDGQRAIAYLYRPKHFSPPHQLIHLSPAADVGWRFRSVPESIEDQYAPFIRSGRAVFAIVLPGFLERDHMPNRRHGILDPTQIEYVEANARDFLELRRGLDIVLARDDIDADRLAFLGSSIGGSMLILPAIESRYRAVILSGAGLVDRNEHRAANGVNFVPLIQPPKLLIHGEYDEASPIETMAKPILNLLSGKKEMQTFPGGHRPLPKEHARIANRWLDEVIGEVKKPSAK
jgi:formylglycine-generating enzyme required for sulfatase activity/pimeloyl-ACP methyl ester carboxylesterase